jgi:integrase
MRAHRSKVSNPYAAEQRRLYLWGMPARPFSSTEISRLESHLLSHGRYRDRMLIIAGTQVGYRITERLTWTVGQVLGPDGDIVREVTVTRADLKGGKGVRKRSVRSRRVVLNERARGVIRDYIASLDQVLPADQFFFQSRSGANRPISRTQAHRILKGLCRECGIDAGRISTHSLRKSFVRAVYDASGHDLVRTMKIVQYASPITTARYLENTQTELDDLVLGLCAPAPVPAAARSLALAS